MTAPRRPLPPVSDEQVVRTFTFITIGFGGALVFVLGTVPFLIPDASVGASGLIIGVVLALVSWFGSAWATSGMLSRGARAGAQISAATAVSNAAFVGIALAELPPLIGFVLAVADGSEVGQLVIAAPVAIVAVVVNASGPGAIRRGLAQVRS